MALTYTTDNFYTIINGQIQAIQGLTPPDMTLAPNYAKSKELPAMTPLYDGFSLQPQKTMPNTALSLIETPIDSQLPTVGEGQSVPESANIPEIAIKTIGSGNANFDAWAKMRGLDYNDPKVYDKYLTNAGYAKMGAAALQGVASLFNAASATDYRREVEKTKTQYETQKKIIDTNIDKTESALMQNLMSNMADLDAMSAAKNVDLSSQAIAGDKAKGAMDLGKDIAEMRTNSSLQKAALDLEYAMNVRKAKQAEINSYVNAGLQFASSAISLL